MEYHIYWEKVSFQNELFEKVEGYKNGKDRVGF